MADQRSPVDHAREYFEARDDKKARVVDVDNENNYLNLEFGFDAGIYRGATEHLVREHNVIIVGLQPGAGDGDVRVWFDDLEFDVQASIRRL